MPRIEPIPYEDLDPELRRRYEVGQADGRYTMTLPLQIFSYASLEATVQDDTYRATFRQGLLGPRLQELLRVRSAQLNGCAPCAASRKEESVGAECLVDGAEADDLTERERRALHFLDLLSTDHHAIDDDTYLDLAEVFTVAEIVELGMSSARYVGGHRWLHTLDVFADREPVLRYQPGQVDATTDRLASPAHT